MRLVFEMFGYSLTINLTRDDSGGDLEEHDHTEGSFDPAPAYAGDDENVGRGFPEERIGFTV